MGTLPTANHQVARFFNMVSLLADFLGVHSNKERDLKLFQRYLIPTRTFKVLSQAHLRNVFCMIICGIGFVDLDFSFFDDKFVARTIDLTISIGREPNNHPHGAVTVIATVAVPAFQGTCHRLPSSFLLGSMWMSYERCHCLLPFVIGYGRDGSAIGSGWTFDDVFPALRPEPQKTNQGCNLTTSDW